MKICTDLGPSRNETAKWVTEAVDYLNDNPVLVQKAWKNCKAVQWDLSYACITSREAISASFDKSVEYWQEITGAFIPLDDVDPENEQEGAACDFDIEDGEDVPLEVLEQAVMMVPVPDNGVNKCFISQQQLERTSQTNLLHQGYRKSTRVSARAPVTYEEIEVGLNPEVQLDGAGLAVEQL